MWSRLTIMTWPDPVREVIRTISQKGYRVYVVGGAVRNTLWEEPVTDWDLAAAMPADALIQLYGDRHPGAPYGTVQAAPGIEVTALRAEGDYRDRRHPGHIAFTSRIEEDLQRRDFTVNAIAVGDGVHYVPRAPEDILMRRWRAVGDPHVRFSEDPLRILRLVRFWAQYGGVVDSETGEAARRLANLTRWVSRERRLGELVRFLSALPQRWPLWAETGLLFALDLPPAAIFPVSYAPQNMMSRLYLFLRATDIPPEDLVDWCRRWPLPRAWRQALAAAFGKNVPLDAQAWAMMARKGLGPDVKIWEDLARAAGVCANLSRPIRMAVDLGGLARRWGLSGPQTGALQRYLRDRVAAQPEANRPEVLERWARDWVMKEKPSEA